MMSLKAELEKEVDQTFASRWETRDGQVVPAEDDIKLGNDAIKLDATVVYADLADSTTMVDSYKQWFSAEIYKTFLHCAAKIIRSEEGGITAYDGDRVMGVFLGGSKNTSAVRAAMKIKWAIDEIIMKKKDTRYPDNSHQLKHVVGIDTSSLFVARTGVRGANDLVWVGRAANYAAKLSSLPSSYTYITSEVYNSMNASVRQSSGVNMWNSLKWDDLDGRTIYRSGWRWRID